MAKSASSKSKSSQSTSTESENESTTGSLRTAKPAAALMDLFIDGIKDIYWAENHLVKNLPKMKKSATSPELVSALTDHLKVTKTHVARLEQVFELLDKNPKAKKCDAMEGMTKEGECVIEDTKAGSAARDLGIIMASQKVEHYEMAAYAGLQNLANKLGLTEIAQLLAATLEEEIQSNDILNSIADNNIPY